MSLESDLAEFYLEFYDTATIDDLKKEIKELEKELEESKQELNELACMYQCYPHGFAIDSRVTENDILVVDYVIIHEKMICQDCQNIMDNASPEHPILKTNMIREYMDLVNNALLCKEKKFHKLTDDELNKASNDAYKYFRYLDKCHMNFDLSNEDIPDGLQKEIADTEDEINALEFEHKFRAIKEKYKTTLVQPDAD
jgi:hypothetical protein